MTSGIYELRFPSGGNYIGKSINVEERWKQHEDKLNKGTAAKPLQEAFSASGCRFSAQLLYECHPHHIDILEECLIYRMQPTLNTTRPKYDPLAGLDGEQFDEVLKHFSLSTLEHISNMLRAETKAFYAKQSLINLEKYAIELQDKRSKEELENDITNRIAELSEEVDDLNATLDVLENKHKRIEEDLEVTRKALKYARLSWWQKLFK